MTTHKLRILCLASVCLAARSVQAENWAQWRGPFFNGFSPERGLPETWSKTENVAWVASLPGPSAATPIVWDDHVFVTAIETDTKKMWAICLNRSDGRVRWKHEVGGGFFNKMGNNGASPSPVTDGKLVWFTFGTGDLLAFDMDGRPVWRRNIARDHGKFKIMWRYGASPLLYRGKLYVAVLHSHDRVGTEPDKPKPASYLLCVDPRTGKDLWKHERETVARMESKEAYVTPYPFEGSNGPIMILPGGDCVTAHRADNGEEVWRSDGYNPRNSPRFRTVPSAVAASGVVFACGARGSSIFGVECGGAGQLTAKGRAWTKRQNAPDVCTPLVMNGKLFVLDGRKKIVTCFEPKTGKIHWKGKLATMGKLQASPTGADGKIYCISMAGEVVMLSAGDAFKVLARINMGESGCRSTISVAHGQFFIRTGQALYCIGTGR